MKMNEITLHAPNATGEPDTQTVTLDDIVHAEAGDRWEVGGGGVCFNHDESLLVVEAGDNWIVLTHTEIRRVEHGEQIERSCEVITYILQQTDDELWELVDHQEAAHSSRV